MDAALLSVLARIGGAALPPSLAWRVEHWDELDEADRAVTRRDLELMAGLLAGL